MCPDKVPFKSKISRVNQPSGPVTDRGTQLSLKNVQDYSRPTFNMYLISISISYLKNIKQAQYSKFWALWATFGTRVVCCSCLRRMNSSKYLKCKSVKCCP